MNKQLPIWELIAESLDQNIPIMLLYVLESKGSSPGRQGFFMSVNAKGQMEGSIGGGIMEHKFVEMVKEKLKASNHELRENTIRKQIHDKAPAKNQSGMICSGEQTVLIYELKPNDKDSVEEIIGCLQQNKNGSLSFSPTGIYFSENIPKQDFEFEMYSEEDWTYTEKIGYKNYLFIIGGGHCALAFSRIMSEMDFYIQLFDDRSDLHTIMQNDFVHEKKTVNDYGELADLVSPGPNHYVVIMTMGYRTDGLALRALMNKEFKYLGLLGSKAKIEKTFADLKREGIADEVIQKIHSPIGINIKSETPEEIAISIAAEIIKLKNM